MTFMEENLDYYAQSNGLRDVNSYLKLILGMGAIFICVASQSPVAPLFILFTISAITLIFAKIPVRVYGELLLIPATFAGLSVIVILFLSGGGQPILSFSIAGVPLTATTGSANLALLGTGSDIWRYVWSFLYLPYNPYGRDLFCHAYIACSPGFNRSFHADLSFYLRFYRSGNSDPQCPDYPPRIYLIQTISQFNGNARCNAIHPGMEGGRRSHHSDGLPVL